MSRDRNFMETKKGTNNYLPILAFSGENSRRMSVFDHVVAFKEKPKLNVEDRLKISKIAFCCLPLNLEGIFHPFPLPKHRKLHVAKLSESNRLVLAPLHKQMPL